jgi:erythromycin esterase
VTEQERQSSSATRERRRGRTEPGLRGEVRKVARRMADTHDLGPLLDRVGDARFVLLGEASHGTADYYRWRAAVTRRLIEERGFSFVGVEGDWPDCYRLHRSVSGASEERPLHALRAIERWPTWMWANEEVLEFADWLRQHNKDRPQDRRVGFYGLDVYSLWESLRAVIAYVIEHDPEHVEVAMQAYRCFEPHGEDPQSYAWATALVPKSCEEAVVAMLTALQSGRAGDGTAENGDDPEAWFDAEQNARAAVDAERYYRAMVKGGAESWHVRDTHMVDTHDRLMARYGDGAKGVVWAQNPHVGDARYTDMARAGMVNVGQLVRERHAADGVVIAGFGGHFGSVIAADRWGAPMQRMPVPWAREGSLEDLLHDTIDMDRALLIFPEELPGWLLEARPHRAIGVVYDWEQERKGNYVPTVTGRRYDTFLWFDRTSALHPLEPVHWTGPEEETYPYGV